MRGALTRRHPWRYDARMKQADTESRRVNTRIPADLYGALEGMAEARGLILTEGRGKDSAAIGQTLAALIREEAERVAKQPTLLALAKTEPEKARDLMLCAMKLGGGNAESARAALAYVVGRSDSVSERDWRSARDLLGMAEEIKRLWPTKRG